MHKSMANAYTLHTYNHTYLPKINIQGTQMYRVRKCRFYILQLLFIEKSEKREKRSAGPR